MRLLICVSSVCLRDVGPEIGRLISAMGTESGSAPSCTFLYVLRSPGADRTIKHEAY